MTSNLALLGGSPEIVRPGPHFTWPPISPTSRRSILRQLVAGVSVPDRSGVVARLEDELQRYFGVRHALLTSSGTVALYSTYAACGIGPDDEVIVPAYTFLATVTPLLHLGAVPVLADCDASGNLDPADVERRITSRTKAIMITHLWGRPANMSALEALAMSRGLVLLEDGSHAHGASIDGRKVGTFGTCAAFSLNGPKPLSGGEGGFVLTDDSETFYRLLLHGQYNKRCRAEIPQDHALYPYAVTGMGLKFRIHPLAAALALDQLGRLDRYLDGRERVANYLCDQLEGLPGITVRRSETNTRESCYGFIIRYHADELAGLPIDRFSDALHAEGCIEVDRPGSTCPLNLHPLFQDPAPLFPQYAGRLAYSPGDFPAAEAVWRSTIKLPVWHRPQDMSIAESYVRAIRKVVEHSKDLVN